MKKLAAYRASLVSKGNGDVSAYGPYGYSAYAELAAQNGVKSSYLHGSGSYIHGQPLPPRPPMQQPHAAQMHHGYMMQQQQQVIYIKQL